MGLNRDTHAPSRRESDIATSRAVWSLRFYCWRNMLWLSVSTVAAIATIIAIVEGRPPPLLGDFMALPKRL
jgi:hypothetical protein